MLRTGEMLVQSAGGPCAVCKERIEPGPAVQLSSKTSAIRHEKCIPKEDTRKRIYQPRFRKKLPD